MAPGIGASGVIGIAFETTAGTYMAPNKYIPIRSESLGYQQDTSWRRNIRGIVDQETPVNGYSRIEGDIEMEVLEDVLPYFLYASRNSVVKTGVTNYVYTTTPLHGLSVPTGRTMSIVVVRNGIVHAYTGCVVGGMEFTIGDGGILMCTLNIIGYDEAVQAAPTASFPTTVPFGAGQFDIQIPSASSVLDVDTFTFSVNDNAEAVHRLRTTGRSPSFIKMGEREVSLSIERDFDSRVDYDSFKALTAQKIVLLASKGANNQVQFTANSAIKDTYEVGLDGQGDLVRASIEYQGVYNATDTKSYEIIVKTQENIV